MSTRPKVLVYATATCPFCIRALDLLERKGVTDPDIIRTDLDPAQRRQMMEITGRHTVPQIFIGDYHVGGCDELHALERAGKLDALLAGDSN